MSHTIRVKAHVRRRPVSEKMRRLLERLGIEPEVSVKPHDRSYTPPARRPSPKKAVKPSKNPIDPASLEDEE